MSLEPPKPGTRRSDGSARHAHPGPSWSEDNSDVWAHPRAAREDGGGSEGRGRERSDAEGPADCVGRRGWCKRVLTTDRAGRFLWESRAAGGGLGGRTRGPAPGRKRGRRRRSGASGLLPSAGGPLLRLLRLDRRTQRARLGDEPAGAWRERAKERQGRAPEVGGRHRHRHRSTWPRRGSSGGIVGEGEGGADAGGRDPSTRVPSGSGRERGRE